jgi:hypothetical protein
MPLFLLAGPADDPLYVKVTYRALGHDRILMHAPVLSKQAEILLDYLSIALPAFTVGLGVGLLCVFLSNFARRLPAVGEARCGA